MSFGASKLEKDSADTVEIEYIRINPSCGKGTIVMSEADTMPIKIGREIIRSLWNTAPGNLKIFKASGDSMQEIINNGDLLLVDTSKTDYINGGIFLLTINNDWFIKRLRLRVTGELDIISDNTKYPIETLQPNTDVEINVKGRVIKNLSRGL
nr:MAG TPA: Repressor protein CI [Caudoviricetes sp.]